MAITILTGVRSDEHTSINLTTMPFEGETLIGISVETSGGGATFHFHSVGELRAFLARATDACDQL